MATAIVEGIHLPNAAASQTSGKMQVGGSGVNIKINGMTGGSVYIEYEDGAGGWARSSNLTYTTDYYDYARIGNGQWIRVVTSADFTGSSADISVAPRGDVG